MGLGSRLGFSPALDLCRKDTHTLISLYSTVNVADLLQTHVTGHFVIAISLDQGLSLDHDLALVLGRTSNFNSSHCTLHLPLVS